MIGERHMQWVPDGRLLLSNYDGKQKSLTLTVIGSTPVTFHDVQPPGNTFQYIAATDTMFLAYFCINGQRADIYLFDVESGTHEIVGCWDLGAYWMQSAVSMGRLCIHPRLGCSFPPGSNDEVLLLGPSEGMRRGHSWGCKLLDFKQKKVLKVCSLL